MRRRIKIHGVMREDIRRVAEEMYIYGYPLLVMDVAQRMHTAAPYPTLRSAPLNQFAHERFLPEPHRKYVPHAHADCLTSSAWLDLSREPVVISIPPLDRYYLFSFFSGWYEIFDAISPRTTGLPGHFGIVGPHWSGSLPVGVKRVLAPTETVWIDGYLAVDGAEDIQLVHGLQDQLRLTPLSDWGSARTPHSLPFRLDVDHKATPQEQVANIDARCFYTRLLKLMQRNPPQECDAEIVAQFARIGFIPNETFVFDMLQAETVQAMISAVPAAQSRIANAELTAGHRGAINNWSLHIHPGRYQTNYLDRAGAARAGLPTALAEDVACFHTAIDHTGEPLKGTHRYVINFCGELTPPVNAFWSITLYDFRQRLVANNIHRHVIGDRDRLRLNDDNSLSIHIQHEWPGISRDSNWLPAPKDKFNLAFRMYWPNPDVLTGRWRPPTVTRTTEV